MKKVFIDGGAHKGEAIEVLLDKRDDLKGCEAHFFESNPDLIEILESIADSNKDYDITIHHSALWKVDGEIDFLDSVERWGTLGGTIIPSIEEKWGLKIDRDNPRVVPATSLITFLDKFSKDDYIVIKLDIEGSEYEVIQALLKSGKIDMVDELYVEWHDHFFPHFKNLGDVLRAKLDKADVKVNNDWM